ncbi:Chaperone protein ClpB1 [Vitis vinifera]|uniref:Chaperone protein ClpB1 n=1 Tax=Vitis vinifera TaxID=29760 RepID=A0A438C4W3_VITVI|nr:Chaperone protein ClpB1 [Vitis vinifera]
MELLNFMLASPVLLTQSPLPDGIPVNTTLIKVVRRAQSSQKSRVIFHLAVVQLVLGLLEDSQISDLLKEAGVITSKLAQKIVRGGVPSNLAEVRPMALDMGALVAGAKCRGEVRSWS